MTCGELQRNYAGAKKRCRREGTRGKAHPSCRVAYRILRQGKRKRCAWARRYRR